jgi:transglutaminase-like putative cysteine protease
MDFHAWFEAYVDGQWRTFDARHNVPRIGRIPIGRGRDAVDVAMLTTYGAVQLHRMDVWSDEVDADGRVLSGLNTGRTVTSRCTVEVAQ